MAFTYSKIATYTVGSGGITRVAFNNIPQNYTDLLLKTSSKSIYTGGTIDYTFMTINNSTASIYSTRSLAGEGGGLSSEVNPYGVNTAWGFAQLNGTGGINTANTFNNAKIYIYNYTSSNYKSASSDFVVENNTTSGQPVSLRFNAHIFNSTSPITSLQFYTINGSSFSQHSTFHLYGIKAEL